MGLDHGLESEARLLYAWRKIGDLSVAEIKVFTPPNVDTDEHVIRRLGWAIVRQWSALPEAVRELIQKQAVFIEDKHVTVQLHEQIKAFIRRHSGAS
jgi:hypothetical protein